MCNCVTASVIAEEQTAYQKWRELLRDHKKNFVPRFYVSKHRRGTYINNLAEDLTGDKEKQVVDTAALSRSSAPWNLKHSGQGMAKYWQGCQVCHRRRQVLSLLTHELN